MIARIVLLITAGLAFAVLLGIPARYLGGGNFAFIHCLTAVLMCLVPAVFTLAWTHWSIGQTPQRAPLMALASSGVRLFLVAVVALVLHLQVPLYREDTFLFWVLAAYMYLLAVEIALLLVGQGQVSHSPAGKTDA